MLLHISDDERSILQWSLSSRILTLSVILLSSVLVPPFDVSGKLALQSSSSSLLARLALPFTQWDTIHWLEIARTGYTTEQQFAFMPGVPVLLRLGGYLRFSVNSNGTRFEPSKAILAVTVLASVVSIFLPVILYRLTLALLGIQARSFAKASALLYCFSPASAVLSIPYTEPFFALFTFTGMLMSARNNYALAACFFASSVCFRANGILNAGFLVWSLVWRADPRHPAQLLGRALYAPSLSLLILLPFLLHQGYAYRLFCLGDTSRPWCANSVPLAYSFVQAHYWDVGFLRYWTLQQVPNFAFATPVLVASFAASWMYYSANWPSWIFDSLPFSIRQASTQGGPAFYSSSLLPYMHLHTMLSLLLLLASHVQISLRQACTNPVIFWYLAHLYESGSPWAKTWLRYSVIWGSVSTILWTAFYPPA